MGKTTRILKTALVALTATVGAGPALAEYPEKPVEFVVPWPPGDAEDVLTRIIAEEFQKEYGVPAAVVNKPGGGGGPFPGSIYAATQPADGYTIGSLVAGVPVLGHQIGIPELTPQPFEPIGIFLTHPFVIATSKDAPYSTIQELAEHSQSNPVRLGHFGAPLMPTRLTFKIAKDHGIKFASDAAYDALDCNTLASGDADVINTTLQLVLPCLDDITVLLSIGHERFGPAPDAPTAMELDPSLTLTLWNGLFVHKDTPQDVRDKIARVAEAAMKTEAALEVAETTGALVYWENAEESAAHIASDIEFMSTID